MQTRLVLIRLQRNEYQTLGTIQVWQGLELIYSCKSLEPPWADNQRNVSCIPAGRYSIKKRHAPKFGHHLHVLGVPNRSYILVHPGNYMDTQKQNSEGCILTGRGFRDINNDGLLDVIFSRNALDEILRRLPEKSILDVIDVADG